MPVNHFCEVPYSKQKGTLKLLRLGNTSLSEISEVIPDKSTIPKESNYYQNLLYSRNLPLKLSSLEVEPGNNLPDTHRRAVMKRDCFIVHSD